MHIADGILPLELAAAGWAGSLAAVYLCGRKVESVEIARMGMVAAASFVASLIHFPIAGTSVHLGLYGLTGVLLGRRAFPVIFTALLFQTLVFQHGGLLTLGLNALNMGIGGLLGWLLYRLPLGPEPVRAFLAGAFGLLAPAFLMAAEFEMANYGRGFYYIATIYSLVALLEGVVTASVAGFFRKVKPGVLETA